MFRPWQRAVKSADWERTFALVSLFFPNYSMSFRDKSKLLYVIRKVILRAIILSNKILKIFETIDFVKILKPSSFLNFQLFWTNKYIIRKGLERGTRFWNQILKFPNNKNFREKSKIFIIGKIQNLISESCSSCQTLSNDVFVCRKNWKLRNEEGFKNFTKSFTKATISKTFNIFLCRIIARKISFRMVCNNLVLTLKLLE